MKFKKFLAFGLVGAMLASMAVGVSATSNEQEVKVATVGDDTPSTGNADVAVEGIIEPTAFNPPINPTDPTSDSDISSTWVDPGVADTSQLLVTAPAKMKFVVRGTGTAAGAASFVTGEGVNGTIRNASAYIPDDVETERVPKEVNVSVSAVSETSGGRKQFNLLGQAASDTDLEDFTTYKGSVKGVGVQMGTTGTPVEFVVTNTANPLGTLEKGTPVVGGSVYPSTTTIQFVDQGLRTAFETGFEGRLVNDYKMNLTFAYIRN